MALYVCLDSNLEFYPCSIFPCRVVIFGGETNKRIFDFMSVFSEVDLIYDENI